MKSHDTFTIAAKAYIDLIEKLGNDELATKAFGLLPYIKTHEDGVALARFFISLGGLRQQFRDARLAEKVDNKIAHFDKRWDD